MSGTAADAGGDVGLDVDVVVVGAGIVGVSAALALAEAGATVTVLDRGDVAGEASGLNAGMIGGGGWGHDPDVEAALRMGSRERFVDLSERRGHDIELDLSGSLTLVSTEAEWAWGSDLVEESESAGRCLELLDREAVAGLLPSLGSHVRGAVFDPLGARADPVAATRAMATEAAAAGATIETGRAVTSLHPRPSGGWDVATAKAKTESEQISIRAEAVVVAAGPWIADVVASIGLQVPIVAVRGQMWASEPAPPLLGHAIAAAESALSWANEQSPAGEPPSLTHRSAVRRTRHLYGRQRANGEIIFGGDRVLGADRAVDTQGIEVNRSHVIDLLPAVGGYPVARTWAGLMPFSVDGLPLIGGVPGHPGLFLAGGLASSGFGRGPMTGRLVASQVLGAIPIEDHPDVDFSAVALDGRVAAGGPGASATNRP